MAFYQFFLCVAGHETVVGDEVQDFRLCSVFQSRQILRAVPHGRCHWCQRAQSPLYEGAMKQCSLCFVLLLLMERL